MSETELFSAIGVETQKLDVLFVANSDTLTEEIGKMLQKQDYCWNKISTERFIDSQDIYSTVGTIVVDTGDVDNEQRGVLIEKLKDAELCNIATILINNAIEFPLDDFRFATILKTTSFNELLGRIETNIRYGQSLDNPLLQESQLIMSEQSQPLPDTIEQLKMAGRVQRDFLPKGLPDTDRIKWASFFMPAEWVSGDIYDVVRLDEHNMGFYVADAVGHSMPAALLTIFIKQAIIMRETTGNDYQIFSPQQVIETLNSRMTEQHLTNCLFATCCYALLNIHTMQMTYCRAGHPYPILIRDGKPIQLESQGGLLGIFTEGEFEQQTVQLKRGDKLLIYSDGVESVVGEIEDGKFAFGESFTKILGLPVKEMIDEFKQLATNREMEQAEVDDMTAIALEIM